MNEPRKFSYVTREIIEKGSIEIHSTEEDMIKFSEVNLYNQYMKECRQKMRELLRLRNYYLLINIVMSIVLMIEKYTPILMNPQEKEVFIRLIIEIILVAVYIFINFVFCLWKGEMDFIPNVVITIPLLFVEPLFWALFTFNIIYCGIYRYKKGGLSEEPGYPLFYDIRIDRIRKKTYDVQRKIGVELPTDREELKQNAREKEIKNESV